jgi:hypothetical protein
MPPPQNTYQRKDTCVSLDSPTYAGRNPQEISRIYEVSDVKNEIGSSSENNPAYL